MRIRPLTRRTVALALALLAVRLHSVAASTLPAMPPPTAGDRILVVSPHPDDETLCCAGYLQRARAAGAAVAVVWVTAGDGFSLDAALIEHTAWPYGAPLRQLALKRISEARAAATELGVPPSQQYFLDYPDHGVQALLGNYRQRVYHSSYTGLEAVSYPGALDPGATYTGDHLLRDLSRVLDTFQPTQVLAAAPEDRHPDHAASGEAARQLLASRGQLNRLRYWIVHANWGWPSPRGLHPAAIMIPPPAAKDLFWRSLALTDGERMRKLAALRCYRSQLLLTEDFMLAFMRENEILAYN